MTTDRIKAYEKLATAARRLASTGASRLAILASRPGETDVEVKERLAGLTSQGAAVLRALRNLDRMSPFERAPEEGVWETLIVEVHNYKAWIGVVNAAGARDRVTTFGIEKAFCSYFEQWCACRENSTQGDTPWDDARRERRVVDYKGEATVIDRGANYVLDFVAAAGCQTEYSCEGHPAGAYLGFRGDEQARVADEFRRLGWTVEEHGGSTTARMPQVHDVAERDAEWRRLSLELSPDIEVSLPLR